MMVLTRPVLSSNIRMGPSGANSNASSGNLRLQYSKRPGPDNGDAGKPAKMLKASQSSSNIPSLPLSSSAVMGTHLSSSSSSSASLSLTLSLSSQSQGQGRSGTGLSSSSSSVHPPTYPVHGISRTMSASASLSSFGEQVSASNSNDDKHISYPDLKAIMKTICEEFWNYEYGHIDIKKAFRSRINKSTCKGLFSCLQTYAEEDSSLIVIRDRINKDFYQRSVEFETDFRLMFYNIIRYFPADHPVSSKAKHLQTLFETKWSHAKTRVSK